MGLLTPSYALPLHAPGILHTLKWMNHDAMIFKEMNAACTPLRQAFGLGGTLEFVGHRMEINQVWVRAMQAPRGST